jgi:hypothetical protein
MINFKKLKIIWQLQDIKSIHFMMLIKINKIKVCSVINKINIKISKLIKD